MFEPLKFYCTCWSNCSYYKFFVKLITHFSIPAHGSIKNMVSFYYRATLYLLQKKRKFYICNINLGKEIHNFQSLPAWLVTFKKDDSWLMTFEKMLLYGMIVIIKWQNNFIQFGLIFIHFVDLFIFSIPVRNILIPNLPLILDWSIHHLKQTNSLILVCTNCRNLLAIFGKMNKCLPTQILSGNDLCKIIRKCVKHVCRFSMLF